MTGSNNTAKTVQRIIANALATSTLETPRFEPKDQVLVCVTIKAPDLLQARGLISTTTWREGLVLLWMEDHQAYKVILWEDMGLAFLVSPAHIRKAPPKRITPAANDLGAGERP